MSEYKKIDKPGWWECQPGHGGRIHVLLIDNGWAFGWRSLTNGNIVATASRIEVNLCKYLPDCNDWNWQPEPEIEEIEFPDWILPGWDYVTRDSDVVAPELWCEKPEPDAGFWNCTLKMSADRTLNFVDTSWVPPFPVGGWKRAIWKRKPKQDDGWIEWAGGEAPIKKGTHAQAKLRNGETISGRGYWRWRHLECYNDIVAYRIIE